MGAKYDADRFRIAHEKFLSAPRSLTDEDLDQLKS